MSNNELEVKEEKQMSLLGTKLETKCTVNGRTVGVDDLVECAIVDLEAASKSLYYLWEQYFGRTEEPKEWKHSYLEISAQLTAYRILMDRITDDLLAAYGMASDFHAARLAILSSNANPECNT